MNTLHNNDEYSGLLKPEGGLQSSLCSNNGPLCSSPLGFTNSFTSEEQAIDYLADILVEAFLDMKKNENNKLKQPI